MSHIEDIPKVYVISLPWCSDRRASFGRFFTDIITYEFFDAVDGVMIEKPEHFKRNHGHWGCLQSHKSIIEKAKANGVRDFIVFEDDVKPLNTFDTLYNTVKEAREVNADLVWLAGHHQHVMDTAGKHIFRGSSLGTYGLYYSISGYDKILSELNTTSVPIDWALKTQSELGHLRAFISKPKLVDHLFLPSIIKYRHKLPYAPFR